MNKDKDNKDRDDTLFEKYKTQCIEIERLIGAPKSIREIGNSIVVLATVWNNLLLSCIEAGAIDQRRAVIFSNKVYNDQVEAKLLGLK